MPFVFMFVPPGVSLFCRHLHMVFFTIGIALCSILASLSLVRLFEWARDRQKRIKSREGLIQPCWIRTTECNIYLPFYRINFCLPERIRREMHQTYLGSTSLFIVAADGSKTRKVPLEISYEKEGIKVLYGVLRAREQVEEYEMCAKLRNWIKGIEKQSPVGNGQ